MSEPAKSAGPFRWRTIDESQPQAQLFDPDQDSAFESCKGLGQFRGIEFLHVRAKKIINEVPGQSRMPFRFTINAYRGCSHACKYCFARPTHEYLNLDPGNDFETKIVVKVNAVERLHAELRSRSWSGDGIAMGTNTDPYQRAEGKYQLTRGIIRELSARHNPFSILTKGTLVTRDLQLLVEAAQHASVRINFSIPTVDGEVWQKTEPGTPHPLRRIDALKKLVDAGLECGVLMAPVLPGISDSVTQMTETIERCLEAGASWVSPSVLHLRSGVKEHWMGWMQEAYPELIPKYRALYAGRAYLSKEAGGKITARGYEIIQKLHSQPI